MPSIDMTEATVLYHYLIEHLLVSDDVEKELKPLTIDEAFIDILKLIIEVDKEEDYFDDEMHKNMVKIFVYLSKDNDNYRDLFNNYSSYPKSGKGNFYLNQVYLKYDSLENYTKANSIIWNKKDIKESVSFDFTAFATLLSCNLEEYINDHFINFAFDQKFLLFVHKLINQYPVIFKDKDIKIKIQSILMYNDMLDNPETEENFKETFIKRNIGDIEVTEEEYHKKYHEFLKDNKRLLGMIINNRIFQDACNIKSYINAYNEDIAENAIHKNGELPNNPLILDTLIKRIKKLGSFEFNQDMKNNLLNHLSDLRQIIGKDQVPYFNECVSYINSTKIVDSSNLQLYNNNPENVHGILKVIIKAYKYIFEEPDIGDKNAYEALNELFDCINGKKEFKDVENLEEKLKALFRIYPNVFTNEDVYQNTKEAIELLPNGKKYAKKIKRIQNKRKV